MLRRAVFAVVLLGFAKGVWAQEDLPPVPEIEQTIQQQMDAFVAGDVGRAFEFASPSIQNMFRTPQQFGMMVERGYPMVWRPADVQFDALREIAGGLWQKVIVVDQGGQSHALDYRMQRVDGEWRISAVQLLPAPDLSV